MYYFLEYVYKKEKKTLSWNMIQWFLEDVFTFVASSLHSALASVKCSGHQWPTLSPNNHLKNRKIQ